MKLTKVRITEFQSIQDSTEFEVGDVTCLVGKNEAGKTALLKALYHLNPIIAEDGSFDPNNDYPRRYLIDYESQVDNEERDPAQVVQATYELEPEDIAAVEKVFGTECLQDKATSLTLKKGYSNELMFNGLSVNSEAALKHLVSTADLPTSLEDQLLRETTPEDMVKILQSIEEATESSHDLMASLQDISGQEFSSVVFHQILHPRIPKFMYFDEYYQMKGQDNIDALRGRVENNMLEEADHPLLGLIDLAGLSLNQLINPRQTSVLRARLEAAANQLTDKVLKYWSQNKHLQLEFDLRPALPEDPPGMTAGTNIWGLVNDTKHRVSTELGTRSRGFIWFFSFLAWYSRLSKERENIILLLDEPGLSLHGKAQEDLLRYFEEQLKPYHQLIYTTHSSSMVDPRHFDRVRIVQDLSLESDSDDLPEEQQGTKVTTEISMQHRIVCSLFRVPSVTRFIKPSSLVRITSLSKVPRTFCIFKPFQLFFRRMEKRG